MRKLISNFEKFQPSALGRLVCKSDYYDDGGSSDGNIWTHLIDAGASIGDQVLQNSRPQNSTLYGATGANGINPQTGLPYGLTKPVSSTNSLLLVAALVAVGFFAFSRMK